MSKEQILIVDDSNSSLIWLSDLMSKAGYHVSCAKSAHEALAILESSSPDLILLDVDMPDMGGLQLCALLKMRARFEHVPILFQSVLSDSNIKVEGLLAGAADFVSKPYNPAEILLRVGIHLQLHALQTTLEKSVEKRTEQLQLEIHERKNIESELVRSNERLLELTAYLQEVREEERRRIAREIHDELGQLLSLANIELKTLSITLGYQALDDDSVTAVIDRLQVYLKKSSDSARSISENLRPGMLDTLGLKPALEFHITNFAHTTNLSCDTEIRLCDEIEINDAHATAVFRVVQESLTNISKHANACSVQIRVISNKSGLVVSIQDDGVGVHKSTASGVNSYGLIGMAERAEMLGGDLIIEAPAGGGTRVEMFLPMWRAENHD